MDNLFQALIGKYDLLLCQSASLSLLSYQIILCNVELLIFRIAVYLNDLHTVQKRPWNGLGCVGRGNEENLG